MRGPRYDKVRPVKPAPEGFAEDLNLPIRDLMRKYNTSEIVIQRWIGEAEIAKVKGDRK